MANLTEIRRRARDDWPIAIGLGAALVAVVLLRTALFGWSPVAPDDARYLFVGLSVLAGDGPVTPSGTTFLLRSPVYGLLLAAGSTVVGGDPMTGARIVALVLAMACLLGVTRIGWLVAGPGGAVGTMLALLATPIVWRLVPSLRIDLPQTAGVVAILLTVWRPSQRRWAFAGVLFGLTILVKETVLPLALLPLALLGLEPARRVATYLGVYLGAALVTAGWWWAVVWLSAGDLFPLNAIGVIEGRDVGLDVRVARPALVLIGLFAASWVAVAWRARTERGPRLLVAAAAGLLPAALYAASQSLNARNYAGLAVLSAAALGIAGAWSVASIRRRLARSGTTSGDETPRATSGAPTGPRRVAAAALLAVLGLGLVGGIVVGQRSAGRPPSALVPDRLAAWLRANTSAGDRVAMTFKDRESMALRLFDSVEMVSLPAVRVDPADDLTTYVWVGLRDRQLFGYTRSAWTKVLAMPPARYLVLSGPHPFTPDALAASLAAGHVAGLLLDERFDDGEDRAEVFAVDPATVAAASETIPLHASADAAMAWLDLAAPADGEAGAIARFLAVEPVVSGGDLDALLGRLGEAACVSRDGLGVGPGGAVSAVRLRPAGACRG